MTTTWALQALEGRTLLSFQGLDSDHLHELTAARAKGGAGGPAAPAIRLDLVALHEFGHSLGLDHIDGVGSIMNSFYNAGYNKATFENDPAVDALIELFDSGDLGWKDSLDREPNDGDIDLTYSFVLDGASMDQGGRSNTFATFNKIFGAGKWQSIFVGELKRWEGASNHRLEFHALTENAVYAFNVSGSVQNDPRFGDIRIATHKFDGAGSVLAHAYFPPPNGTTAAGDAHFDSGENWAPESSPVVASSTQPASANTTGSQVLGDTTGNPFSNSAIADASVLN